MKLNIPRTFISYSSKDIASLKLFVDSISEKLNYFNVSIYTDNVILNPGDDWSKKLNKAQNECSIQIFLISKNYLDSEECKKEYNYAKTKYSEDADNIKLIPVLLSACEWSLLNEINQIQVAPKINGSIIPWNDCKSHKQKSEVLNSILTSIVDFMVLINVDYIEFFREELEELLGKGNIAESIKMLMECVRVFKYKYACREIIDEATRISAEYHAVKDLKPSDKKRIETFLRLTLEILELFDKILILIKKQSNN